ncbi:MAG: fructosamine kinase family protein [Phycisphaerales bacterium]
MDQRSPNTPEAALIREAVAHVRRGLQLSAMTPCAGGCTQPIYRIAFRKAPEHLIAKLAQSHTAVAALHEEVASLNALAATETIKTPEVAGLFEASADRAVLILEYLEPAAVTTPTWQQFGEQLAALHLHVGEGHQQYGFAIDNHIGSTPQPNAWCDDWVEFNRVHRLGFQIERAAAAGLLEQQDRALLDDVMDRLDDLLPRNPRASLLHGDLWSGNALPTSQGAIAVIDPACSVGDGWADIAMMQLFGGFPDACFGAYADTVESIDPAERARRIAVYQLYHVINHINIFGKSYRAQMLSRIALLC